MVKKILITFIHCRRKKTVAKVEYRIAYVVFCIENSASGRWLFEVLKEISTIDPKKTSSFVVLNGSGKDRSILMHCKWSRIDSSVKTR
jgi:hypothetical protein